MKIYLHFYGTSQVSFGAVEEIANQLRSSLFEIEKRELRRIRQTIPEIPSSVVTQATELLDQHANDQRVFQLQAVKEGSVGVYLVVTALAYWILDKTLSDTVSEAWKQTEMHRKIKSFFLRGQNDKLRLMQKDINKSIQRVSRRQVRTDFTLEVPMRAELDEVESELSIRIEYSEYIETHVQLPTYTDIEEDDDR